MPAVARCTQQAFIDAPVDLVWKLASDPDRQTEWWPDTLEFECVDGNFEQGCRIRNVFSRPWPMSDLKTTATVEQKIAGREIVIRCQDTGTYMRAVLTEGQGGTFIEMEAGNDPRSLGTRVQMSVVGNRLFRRWVDHAVEKLRGAAERARVAAA
jgi:uncharacterized protein YndB with AHSA1/START domain